MNEGARDANDAARHREERNHRAAVIALLTEIRDLMKWRFRDDPVPDVAPLAANGENT